MNANAEIIRPDSEEKLVMSVTLYQGENKLFYDSALAKPVTQEEAIDLFNKGLMLIAVDSGFKRPTGITIGRNGVYSIAFGEGGGEGGQDNGNILCYAGEYDNSLYLFEDSEHTIPITSGKDPLWYSRLVLDHNGADFRTVTAIHISSISDDKCISFSESTCYLDYNG